MIPDRERRKRALHMVTDAKTFARWQEKVFAALSVASQ